MSCYSKQIPAKNMCKSIRFPLVVLLTSVFVSTGCSVVTAQSIDSANVERVRSGPAFLRYGKRNGKLILTLTKLYVEQEMFFLEITLQNRSTLSYPLDFLRIYVCDQSHTNRSSQQELEIIPRFADTLRVIPALSKRSMVLVIDKFTIPEKRACLIEIFEYGGGRNLTLSIRNRQLFLARTFSKKSKK